MVAACYRSGWLRTHSVHPESKQITGHGEDLVVDASFSPSNLSVRIVI